MSRNIKRYQRLELSYLLEFDILKYMWYDYIEETHLLIQFRMITRIFLF